MTWDEIYALYCVETGWTWEYVGEEMTMPRAEGFLGIWKHTPPLRALVTAIAVGLGMPALGGTKQLRVPKRDIGSYLEGLASAGIAVEQVTKHG